MKVLLTIALCALTMTASANCYRCEQLREYHASHPENNYEYYEDYLADQEGQQPDCPEVAEETVEK